MIQITIYRDKGGRLGGLRNTVISNLMPWWIGRGSYFPVNKQPEKLPVTSSGRIIYTIKHIVYIILYMGVSLYITGKLYLTNYIYVQLDCSRHKQLRMEHEWIFILWPMRYIVTRVWFIIPSMWNPDEMSNDNSFMQKYQNNIEQGTRNLTYNILGLRKSRVL